jgi:DNA invertase Pin-like site-specific DNA recombinase
MNVGLYARVSMEEQAKGDSVSIEQQIANMQELCERNGWTVVQVFVDAENYRASQAPNRGKVVNPSGERADRPAFLEMLEMVKVGKLDIVLCWRDDRLVRHPRVAVALEDALDLGDATRNGRPKIEIRDATGTVIDRFTLSIKATIWREENKRRAERGRMGKEATLQQGYWPGSYWRYGYKTRRGPRGRIIEVDEEEAQIVRKVHEMFDAGKGVWAIRRYLVSNEVEQKGHQARRHDWCPSIIYNIIQSEDYTGTATWKFGDGTRMSIDIPPIISYDLWKRNQARLEKDKVLSPRNAKGIYLLQGMLYCGECGLKMSVRGSRHYFTRNGEKRPYKNPPYDYVCYYPSYYPEKPHARPYVKGGRKLDWLVWRQIADRGISKPELIREQVQQRQAALVAEGDSVNGEIAHARRRLAEVEQERTFYQRQAARGKMTEREFDGHMEETEESLQHWQAELERLMELRDNAAKVQAGLDYATELLTTLQDILPDIDQTPRELKAMPKEERDKIMRIRRTIVRALCDRVYVYSDWRIRIEGMLDGGEAREFDLASSSR